MYTRKFGYDFMIHRCAASTERPYLWGENEHYLISWSKSLALLKHLRHYDYIMFHDADAMFVNHSYSIENFIREYFPTNASVVMQSDCYDNDEKMGCWNRAGANTGLIIVKNSPTGFDILKEWANAADDERCNKIHHTHPRDQMCFQDHVLPKYKESIVVVDSDLWRGLDGTWIVHGYESRQPGFFKEMAFNTFLYLIQDELYGDAVADLSTPPWTKGHPKREW